MITDFFAFIGRFHPLLVHLPIGILLVAVTFQFIQWRISSADLRLPLTVTLWAGAVSALLACGTGYLLSQTADYDANVVFWHQWLGISLALISFLWLFMHHNRTPINRQLTACAFVLTLLLVTGHLGGTLTHGSDYLSFNNSDDDTSVEVPRKPLPDAAEAIVYRDIVQPVLETRCYSCHGDTKQKGKLRLDIPEYILKGGKNGSVLSSEGGEQAELIRRILLPVEDKKHMPPKEKKQMTAAETALIHWWVKSGASFEKKSKELPQDAAVKALLSALENPLAAEAAVALTPEVPVEKADPVALQKLRDRGAVVLPVSANSNYLSANFVSVDRVTDDDMKLLQPINKQLVSLKVGDTRISDSGLAVIGSLTALRRLHIERTAITDKGLPALNALSKLQDLNLVGTAITSRGVMQLKNLKSIKNIYLFETSVIKTGWAELQQAFPNAHLDSGGYIVPVLHSDTTLVEPVQTEKN